MNAEKTLKVKAKKMSADEIEALNARPIDYSDIPKITAEQWENGRFRNWKPVKKPISFRIDLDNLDWLQSDGAKGYQKKLNSVLRWARQNNCPLVH